MEEDSSDLKVQTLCDSFSRQLSIYVPCHNKAVASADPIDSLGGRNRFGRRDCPTGGNDARTPGGGADHDQSGLRRRSRFGGRRQRRRGLLKAAKRSRSRPQTPRAARLAPQSKIRSRSLIFRFRLTLLASAPQSKAHGRLVRRVDGPTIIGLLSPLADNPPAASGAAKRKATQSVLQMSPRCDHGETWTLFHRCSCAHD